MPIYEYECPACGVFEVQQGIKDHAINRCPTCRSRRVRKLISATSFQLKGSGWYQTDYGRGKCAAAAKANDEANGNGNGGNGKATDAAKADGNGNGGNGNGKGNGAGKECRPDSCAQADTCAKNAEAPAKSAAGD